MVAHRVAIAFLLCSSASALRISQEDPESDYIPYNKLPQYHPDGIPLFAGCPEGAPPKVAVLVAGRASGMVHPGTVASFRSHIVDYFHSKGARGLANESKPDVFIHVKTGAGQVVRSRSDANQRHVVVSHEMCEEAATEMGATSHVIEDGWGEVTLKAHDCFKTKKQKTADHPEETAGYWKSVQGAFTLMAEQEKKMLNEYDIVIFHRPDATWSKNIDYAKQPQKADFKIEEMEFDVMVPADFYAQNSQSVSCKHGHIWGDQVMIIPRAASKPFMTLYDDLALQEHPKICGIERNEDVFWRIQKSLAAEGFSIDWSMARNGPTGPGQG